MGSQMPKLIFVFFLCLWASNAKAQSENGADLLRIYDSGGPEVQKITEMGLTNFQEGLAWANIFLEKSRHENPFYCAPANLALTGQQIINILRRAIKEQPYLGKTPFRLATFMALQTTFPCPGK